MDSIAFAQMIYIFISQLTVGIDTNGDREVANEHNVPIMLYLSTDVILVNWCHTCQLMLYNYERFLSNKMLSQIPSVDMHW